jgi:hypothetical protein
MRKRSRKEKERDGLKETQGEDESMVGDGEEERKRVVMMLLMRSPSRRAASKACRSKKRGKSNSHAIFNEA